MAISPKNSALGLQEGPHRLPQQIADGVDLSQLNLFKGWLSSQISKFKAPLKWPCASDSAEAGSS